MAIRLAVHLASPPSGYHGNSRSRLHTFIPQPTAMPRQISTKTTRASRTTKFSPDQNISENLQKHGRAKHTRKNLQDDRHTTDSRRQCQNWCLLLFGRPCRQSRCQPKRKTTPDKAGHAPLSIVSRPPKIAKHRELGRRHEGEGIGEVWNLREGSQRGPYRWGGLAWLANGMPVGQFAVVSSQRVTRFFDSRRWKLGPSRFGWCVSVRPLLTCSHSECQFCHLVSSFCLPVQRWFVLCELYGFSVEGTGSENLQKSQHNAVGSQAGLTRPSCMFSEALGRSAVARVL